MAAGVFVFLAVLNFVSCFSLEKVSLLKSAFLESELQKSEATGSPKGVVSPGPGIFDLYYYTNWETCYLHYNADNQGWNSIPGFKMVPSPNASYPNTTWQFAEVGANTIVFVTTDGNGHWDNNNGQNYVANNPGIYSLENGDLQTIEIFPKGCPGSPPCSGHGTCNSAFECQCDSGYYGAQCAGVCPGGAATPCDDHGTCNSDGTCTCSFGYASCTTDACETDVMSDPLNCGGCNQTCTVSPGVVSASCKNATCYRQCASGYVMCEDGSCSDSGCPLPGCQTYTDNQCVGNQTETPSNFTNRLWQTPLKGSEDYRPWYQDMGLLVGYLHVVYDSSHSMASVQVMPTHKFNNVTFSYNFNGTVQSSPVANYSNASVAGYTQWLEPLYIVLTSSDGAMLVFDEYDFMWNNPLIDDSRPGDYRNGQKGAIVELFGWPHDDVAQECEFLSQAGYLGAKVYPAMEQVMSNYPFQNVMNPWFFMYQPMSYRLQGRMGNRTSLRNMIQTCRQQNVRVYADAVLNHMVGGGNDAIPVHRDNNCNYWTMKNSSAFEGPSPSFTQDFNFLANENTGLSPSQEFPSVPWGPTDFHCERPLNSWTDPLDLNAGWLDGLVDINTDHPNVQQRQADYLTELLGIGFSGFRIDAGKHIQPDDWVGIFSALKNNLGGAFPEDFVVYMEILLGGEADMLLCDTDSGYNYGAYFSTALSNAGFTDTEVDQIKIWYSAYPKETDVDCGMVSMTRKVVENDDADQQTPGSTSRDMGSDGSVLVVEMNIPLHRSFEVILFTNPYGSSDNNNDYPIRLLLSSYYFNIANQPYGIPDGYSDCSLCEGPFCGTCEYSMNYTKAYQPDAVGYAGTDYTRTHRDATIISAMRSWMQLPNDTTFMKRLMALPIITDAPDISLLP